MDSITLDMPVRRPSSPFRGGVGGVVCGGSVILISRKKKVLAAGLLVGLLLLGVTVGVCDTAARFRQLADSSLAAGLYQQAAGYYRLEAQAYNRVGDLNAAKVEEMKAEQWTTEMGLYQTVQPDRKALESHYTGAKYEPLYGCYLGAYALTDFDLPVIKDSTGRTLPAEAVFGQVVGKHLATAFDYCRYGDKFPLNWAKDLCGRGIAPHISMEPNDGLQYVKDDEYLRQFARDAASCGGPVFLRFASEMNGSWTNYHDDPALYRAKFKLVHEVMARLAPNVAMMWCVYEVPEYNIDSYYPGDAYVDWVGINIYSVLHHNNTAEDVSEYENPATMLKYVYSHYAARKPIAICEYAASHRESMATSIDCGSFATGKLADMFTALPRLYPRVKLIDIFDCNNIKYGRTGRKVNDYSVTDDPGVLAEFRRLVASDYYLSTVLNGPQTQLPLQIEPLQRSTTLHNPFHLTAWVKTYENHPAVAYWLDGKRIAWFNAPGEYPLNLEFSKIGGGQHVLRLEAMDAKGKTAGVREATIALPGPAAAKKS